METKVITGKNIRFSYAHVFRPHTITEGQEPKYSVCLLIRKDDKETLGKIKRAIEAAKEEGKRSKWEGKIPANLKMPLRDGDEERPENEEYAGCYFVNANSNQKPQIVDANLDDIIDQTEFYSGCYGRASINFFAYNTAGNRGIGCGLNNIQKLRDGEPLSGRSSAKDDFEIEEEDDLLGAAEY